MPIDKEELAKLSPEQRLKKLRSMEEAGKKESDEIGALIKKSMQEMKIDKIAKDVAPEQRAVDISGLFEANHGHNLERTAGREARGKAATGYHAIAQAYQAYGELKSMYTVVSSGGSLTEEQRAAIGQIGEKLSRAEKYMTESEKTSRVGE